MAEKSWLPFGGHHKLAGLYELKRTLGRGHFAVVKLAQHMFTGENVAIKVIDKTKLDQPSMDHLYHEVTCMKLVQHPNVVRLYEVIETSTKLYLILELGDGGDMYDYIMRHDQGLDEEQAKEYFAQILCAISYCHKMHVVHRDLKPENIVFFESQGLVKLTDFGFSNRYDPGKKLSTSCGSLAYSAPEILLGEEYDAQAVDVWSLGVILYMLVCGEAPFNEANDSETLTNIMDCKYQVLDHVDKDCGDLIRSMIIREPEERLNLEEIRNHPWLRDCATLRDDVYNSTPVLTRDLISEELHLGIIDRMVRGKLAQHEEIEEAIKGDKYDHVTSTYFLLAHRSLDARQKSRPPSDTVDIATSEVKTVPRNNVPSARNAFLSQNTDYSLPTPKASLVYGSSPPIQALVVPVGQTGLHAPALSTHSEGDWNEDSSPASSNSSLYFSHSSHAHLTKGDRKMSPPFPREHLTITPRHGFSVVKGGIVTLIEEEERSRSQTTTDDEDDVMANREDDSITSARIINPVQLESQLQRVSLQMKRFKKRKSAPVLNEICEENEAEATDVSSHSPDAFHLKQDLRHHHRRHAASLRASEKPMSPSKSNVEMMDCDVFKHEEPTVMEDVVPELRIDISPTLALRQGRALLKRAGRRSSGSETSDEDSESRRESRSNLHSAISEGLYRTRRDSSGDRDEDGRGACGGRRIGDHRGFSAGGRNAGSDITSAENASCQNGAGAETRNDMTEPDNSNFNNSASAEVTHQKSFFRCVTPNILMPVPPSDSAVGDVLNNFRGRHAAQQHPTPCNHICNIPQKRSKSAESNPSTKSDANSSQTSSARSSNSSLGVGCRRGRILTVRGVRKNSRSTMSDTGLVRRWNNLRTAGIPTSSSSSSISSLLITVPSSCAGSRLACNSPSALHRPRSEGNVTDAGRLGSFRSKSRKRQSRSTSLPRPCRYVRNNLSSGVSATRAASCGPYIRHGSGRMRQCSTRLAAPKVSYQPSIPESRAAVIDDQMPGAAGDARESNIKRSNISLASSTCSASKYAVDPYNELVLSPMEEMEESLHGGSLTKHGPNMKFFRRAKRSTASSTSADSLPGRLSKLPGDGDPPTPSKISSIKMTFFSADGIFRCKTGGKTQQNSSSSGKKLVANGPAGRNAANSIPGPNHFGTAQANSFDASSPLVFRKTRADCCVVM